MSPQTARHQPQRSCIACRTARPQRELVRLVRAEGGAVAVDGGAKRAAGRGAYLCRDSACWSGALERDVIARALRTTLSDGDRAALVAHAERFETAATAAGGETS